MASSARRHACCRANSSSLAQIGQQSVEVIDCARQRRDPAVVGLSANRCRIEIVMMQVEMVPIAVSSLFPLYLMFELVVA